MKELKPGLRKYGERASRTLRAVNGSSVIR